jgi:hypothetical protein
MKRRHFIKAAGAMSLLTLATLVATSLTSSVEAPTNSSAEPVEALAKKEIYEWRIYTLNGEGALLDDFLAKSLLPAYQRKKIKTGAFKPLTTKDGEEEKRHILFIYPDIQTYLKVKQTIWEDKAFLESAKQYFDLSAPKPEYFAFESYLSEAFDFIPVHRKPDAARGIFEIRIYHSPNEEASKRKVKMFNVDEIKIFDAVGVNSVFYGDIIAGPNLPAIMYMTWYKDEPTRTVAWDKFRDHPDWKRISKLPEYANTATRNQSILLKPMDYSEL